MNLNFKLRFIIKIKMKFLLILFMIFTIKNCLTQDFLLNTIKKEEYKSNVIATGGKGGAGGQGGWMVFGLMVIDTPLNNEYSQTTKNYLFFNNSNIFQNLIK